MRLHDPIFWRRLRGILWPSNLQKDIVNHYIPNRSLVLCPHCFHGYELAELGLRPEHFAADIICQCGCQFEAQYDHDAKVMVYRIKQE